VLFLATTAGFDAVISWRSPRLGSLLSLKGAAAFLAGTILASIVFLPFHYRFGFWRGMWSFIGTSLLLAIAGLNAAARIVPGEVCALDPASSMPGAFASTARGLRALAWLIATYIGRPAVIAAAAVVMAVLTWLSFRLSVRFHRNRDL